MIETILTYSLTLFAAAIIFIIALGIVCTLLNNLTLLVNDFLITRKSKSVEKWAADNQLTVNSTPTPFKAEFNQAEWNGLVQKLNQTRYFEALDSKYAPYFEFGFDIDYAQNLVDHWKSDNFNWSNQVDTVLNKYPQFKIQMDGDISLHYVRYLTNRKLSTEGGERQVIRLLLLDGWPGNLNKLLLNQFE